MAFTPHVMCAECEHVFPSEAGLTDTVKCPKCGYRGPPKGVMRPSGPPDLETFTRNWRLSQTGGEDASGPESD
jgi:hypothetical protein